MNARPDTDVCALCIRFARLCNSHIIPNAYFRSMKRNNSGRLITFDSADDTKVSQSIKSWCEHLLCGDCEKRISRWETISIEMLRNTGKKIERSGNSGASIQSYDYLVLRLFLFSILWRASISTLKEFEEIVLPTNYQEDLRQTLYVDDLPKALTLNCRMMKIVDKDKIFNAENFENIAISPFIEIAAQNGKCTFIFGGYVLEFFVPRMPHRLKKQLGVLRHEQKQFIPTINMTSIPRLMNLFVAGASKDFFGKRPR